MVLGYLLARAGVDVVVLEKHADFLRDFRGDTVHPSTLDLIGELGLEEAFLARPHQRATSLELLIEGQPYKIAEFDGIRARHDFIAFMPQWEFLDFFAQQARAYPGFRLLMSTEAEGFHRDVGERIVGVRARNAEGSFNIAAGLVVAADGRNSRLREDAGLAVNDIGAPIDVLWMSLPREPSDPPESLGAAVAGSLMALINRGDYWQCAMIIAKGQADAIKAEGLEAFRKRIEHVAPMFTGRTQALKSLDDVKLLSVQINRLEQWHKPGVLFIGDAAHAMSPAGGVGINLAIQDAVAAANLLVEPLRAGRLSEDDLERVERRRRFPTRITQRMQVLAQSMAVAPSLEATTPLKPALPVRLLNHMPALRRFIAEAIGMGARPEHVSAELRDTFRD
jgi:2-polyprenyl-6-methoxyphenol hydroxylase-like FAD-dependent oxidoreductase